MGGGGGGVGGGWRFDSGSSFESLSLSTDHIYFPELTELFKIKQEKTITTEPPTPLSDSSTTNDFVLPVIKENNGEATIAVDHVDFMINGWGRNNWSSLSSTSDSILSPKPIRGLYESGPPPFLKKTYEMVEDPETDSVVSWSPTRNSFIVWDLHKLSENVLPKYFKHKNYSSFIRQLNTYGFKKIDSDRWEFANEAFQRGKKHLLKNIKRRNRSNKQENLNSSSSATPETDSVIESLKNDQTLLRLEISELKRQCEDSEAHLSAVKEQIRFAECRQQHILNFFTKVVQDPTFVQKLIQKQQKNELEGRKRRRIILENQGNDNLFLANQGSDNLFLANQETKNLQESDVSWIDSSIQKVLAGKLEESFACGSNMDMPFDYGAMKDNLMEGCSVVENVDDEGIAVSDSKVYLELEELISEPLQSCFGYAP